MSSGGRVPEWRGIRFVRACSIGRDILLSRSEISVWERSCGGRRAEDLTIPVN